MRNALVKAKPFLLVSGMTLCNMSGMKNSGAIIFRLRLQCEILVACVFLGTCFPIRSPNGCEAVTVEPTGTTYDLWLYNGTACAKPPGNRNCQSPASRCPLRPRHYFHFSYDFRADQSGSNSIVAETCRKKAGALPDTEVSSKAMDFLINVYGLDTGQTMRFRKAIQTGTFRPVPDHVYNCCVLDTNTGFCSMAATVEDEICRCVSVMHDSQGTLFD